MVYNPRDHNWIPNATENPWANCPSKDSEHEYHVIRTLGWSLQLTNITLTFDVAPEHMYYGKVRIQFDIERDYCPPNHPIKTTVIWNQKTTAVFLMLADHMQARLKSKKDILSKHLRIVKLFLVTNTMHTCIQALFKNTYMINLHSLVLRFSKN